MRETQIKPMPDLASRIQTFTAHERGMSIECIRLESRLSHDLGMDGDDAVEFFEAFGKSFSIDLAPLYKDWSRYFGPEWYIGLNWRLAPLVIFATAAGFLLSVKVGLLPQWVWTVSLALIALFLFHRYRPYILAAKMLPITVQDLIDAANAGKWIKPFPNVPARG